MTRFEPLTYPLAGLLAQPPGTRVTYPIAGVTIALDDEMRLAAPIEGAISVTRTSRGIFLDASLGTVIAGTCSRCLIDIEIPLAPRIVEEVLPTIDLASGAPVDRVAEPDAVRLTDHHELEMAPLVREAVSLAEPIAPLCRPDCPGLCLECGARLADGHAGHVEDEIDPRMASLQGFRVDADAENG